MIEKFTLKLFKSKYFPLIAQLLMFLAYCIIVYGGLGKTNTNPEFLKILRNTNLSNLVVWSYWWPILVISAILLGRLWCMICPMELVTSISSKIGFKLRVPAIFKSGWGITIFYVITLIIGIHTFAIHRVPHYMATYMILLFALAMLIGLIFEKRAFCEYFCPVGFLIGLYSKLAPVMWRVKSKDVCRSCRTKDCIAKNKLYNFQGRSCTNNIYPAELEQNGDCIFCTQCAKVCPNDNVNLFTRTFFKDIYSPLSITLSQAVFVLVTFGFVVYEIVTEWTVTRILLKAVPSKVNSALGITSAISGTVQAVILFIILPLLFWLIIYFIDNIRNKELTFTSYLKKFSICFIPILAGSHLIKAILKMTSRIPYIPMALNDPDGITTAQKIINKTITTPTSINILQLPITFVAVMILIISIYISLKSLIVIQKRDKKVYFGVTIGILAYWLIFIGTISWWRIFS